MTSSATLIQQGRLAEAEAGLRQLLARTPEDAATLTNLGVVLQLQSRFEEAEACYRQALSRQPNLVMAHNNLGVVLQARDCLDEAIFAFQRALTLRPDYQDALNGLGVALQAQGRLEQAVQTFRQVLALRPDHAEAHTNLATALLTAGEFETGFCELEWRSRAEGRTDRMPEGFAPEWRGEDLSGRTLLVFSEQGAGDTFQFVRYLAPLKAVSGAKTLMLLAPNALARLLVSLEGLDRLVTAEDPPPEFDYFIRLLSLPHRLGTTADTIPDRVPYLNVPASLVEHRRRQLAALPRRKVGLVWHGNPRQRNNRKRSLPQSLWPLLGRAPGISWVNLQADPSDHEAALLERMGALDLSPSLTDWAETAAVLAALDLVITVDTGVAHLAGALGVPVWLLLSFAPDWRWQLGRDDSPWYPSLRLFRQPRPGDWTPVLEAVTLELEKQAESQAPQASHRSQISR